MFSHESPLRRRRSSGSSGLRRLGSRLLILILGRPFWRVTIIIEGELHLARSLTTTYDVGNVSELVESSLLTVLAVGIAILSWHPLVLWNRA